MNILFYKNETIQLERGGIDRVTDVLGRAFEKQHNVYYLMAICEDESKNRDNFYYLPNSEELFADENILFARQLFYKFNINIIINQEGITPASSMFILRAKTDEVKLFTVVHNTLTSIYGAKGHFSPSFLQNIPSFIYHLLDKVCLDYFRFKYKDYWNYVLEKSDKIIMLSKSLENNLNLFLRNDLKIQGKITSIPNPVTLQVKEKINKEKRILFVGRLSAEKQPFLLLKIWKCLQNNLLDYHLDIVGEGKLRPFLERYAVKHNIRNVHFYGKQDPIKYYEKATLFFMTSSYEGMPLTILEAMSFQCVPIVFDSFPTVHDLIDNNKNGLLIPSFDIDEFVNQAINLLNDEVRIREMQYCCERKVKKFSLVETIQQWETLFNT